MRPPPSRRGECARVPLALTRETSCARIPGREASVHVSLSRARAKYGRGACGGAGHSPALAVGDLAGESIGGKLQSPLGV